MLSLFASLNAAPGETKTLDKHSLLAEVDGDSSVEEGDAVALALVDNSIDDGVGAMVLTGGTALRDSGALFCSPLQAVTVSAATGNRALILNQGFTADGGVVCNSLIAHIVG